MIKEIVGKKLGMTQIFDEEARRRGVTVVEVEPVCILEKVEYPRKGLKARIGCFRVEESKIHGIRKPQRGYFEKLGVACYKMIKEVDVINPQEVELKKEVGVEIFSEGEKVNVRAKTKGRGFQGGMKRYGWAGQPASHGSTTHRRIGSAGATTFPGRVIKGLHMPGHMGNKFVTIKNLEVVKVDKEKGIIFLEGAVPGPNGGLVYIKKTQ